MREISLWPIPTRVVWMGSEGGFTPINTHEENNGDHTMRQKPLAVMKTARHCAQCAWPVDGSLRRGLCGACYARARRAAPEVMGLVDAGPTRAKILALTRQGWKYREIARAAAGLSYEQVRRIAVSARRVNTKTAAAVAAVVAADRARYEQRVWDTRRANAAAKQAAAVPVVTRGEQFKAASRGRRRVTRRRVTPGDTFAAGLGRLPDWRDGAPCGQTDPELFFPEKGGTTRPAKAVCMGCEVRAECLEWALANGERFGIWGGKSERERRALLIERDGLMPHGVQRRRQQPA